MKHLKLFSLIIILITIPEMSCLAGEEKTKIGIMNVEVSDNLNTSFEKLMYNTLLDEMLKSGKYTVVDGDEVAHIIKETVKSHPGISKQTAKKKGLSQLGIRKLYVGSLSKIGSQYFMSVKVLDSDFTVERVEKASTRREKDLEECIKRLSSNLLVSRQELMARATIEKKQEEEKRRLYEARHGKEIGRDNRYIAYDKGLVKDTKTGLIWADRDNGSDITWGGAKSYCKNYKAAGYADWRMPTQDEVAGLYDRTKKNRLGYAVTELINITACCPWASETRGAEAASFSFYSGSRYWLDQSSSYHNRRALPVRADR